MCESIVSKISRFIKNHSQPEDATFAAFPTHDLKSRLIDQFAFVAEQGPAEVKGSSPSSPLHLPLLPLLPFPSSTVLPLLPLLPLIPPQPPTWSLKASIVSQPSWILSTSPSKS